MYIERLYASPFSHGGEVIFFPGQLFHPKATLNRATFPDTISLVRHNMALDQSAEISSLTSPEKHPAILDQTNRALEDLFKKSIFQRNGIVAGTCLRLQGDIQSEIGRKIDPPVVTFIRNAAIDQVDPRDIMGHSFRDKNYHDTMTAVHTLANLRQVTGSLETGNPQVDQKMPEQFKFLNGQLFDLNRAGGRETLLEDLRLAVLLKQAFPEQANLIDVNDIHYGSGGVMPGHAKEIAREYFSRSASGKLFSVPGIDKRPLIIQPGRTDLTGYNPPYQTELVNGYQINFGSDNLAAVSIARFLAEFEPVFLQSADFKSQVLDRAQDDLIRYKNKHPEVFSDPQFVLLYGEHLANIQTIRKLTEKSETDSLPIAKSA
jgi:hypothetical protein